MQHFINFFFLVLLTYSTTTFSEQYFLNVFEKELPVPIDYSINPWGYSKNTKVRLIRRSDEINEWTEITVSDITESETDYSEVFSEEDSTKLLTKEKILGIYFLQYENIGPLGKGSFYFVYDEKILVEIRSDNKLVERWKELLKSGT